MSKQLSPWKGAGVEVVRPGAPALIPRSMLQQMTADAQQMRYQRLIAEHVGEELSQLSTEVFRLMIDTLRRFAAEIDHASFLTAADHEHLTSVRLQYLAAMTGINNNATLRLYRMLEQLPTYVERNTVLDQLWDWFVAN